MDENIDVVKAGGRHQTQMLKLVFTGNTSNFSGSNYTVKGMFDKELNYSYKQFNGALNVYPLWVYTL